MSDALKDISIRKARTYNEKSQLTPPVFLYSEYPELASPKGSVEFYNAVRTLQASLGMDIDGLYGPGTHTRATKAYQPYGDFLVLNGQRLQIDTKGLFYVTDFTEDSKVDLHKWGNFSKRKAPISFIVLHYGGYNPHHLADIFSTSDRKVSSHIGLGFDNMGQVYVTQYLDFKYQAWHCGAFNTGSIGIDFAFQVDAGNQKRYGWPLVDNTTSKGPKKVLRPPQVAFDAMHQLLKEIARITGLGELNYNQDVEAMFTAPSDLGDINVICHSMVKGAARYDTHPSWCHVLEAANHETTLI